MPGTSPDLGAGTVVTVVSAVAVMVAIREAAAVAVAMRAAVTTAN
jgi:hypothetical protein